MNLKNRIIALVAATAVAVPAIALAKHHMKGDNDKHTPMAHFSAKLNAGGGIDGKTADITLNDDDKNIVIKVDLGRINTGMKLRNEHFQSKFLKGKKNAVLTVKKADVKGKSGEVNGKLKLNDKERDVKVKYSKSDDGDRLKVSGSTNIKYTDFGWEKMCYLGVCVEEDVKISADMWVSKE